MNPPWEETMDEEDVELEGIQNIIRHSLRHGLPRKTSITVPDLEIKNRIRGELSDI